MAKGKRPIGRPSALSDKAWTEVGRRLREGESARSLAKEFGVSHVAILTRFSERNKNAKAVAHELVSAESKLRLLPVSDQLVALDMAEELRSISRHLAGAARYGAATAHRLAGVANAKVREIDDAAPLDGESVEALKNVSVLTKLANDSATIGLNLLAANKDAAAKLHAPPATQVVPMQELARRIAFMLTTAKK